MYESHPFVWAGLINKKVVVDFMGLWANTNKNIYGLGWAWLGFNNSDRTINLRICYSVKRDEKREMQRESPRSWEEIPIAFALKDRHQSRY